MMTDLYIRWSSGETTRTESCAAEALLLAERHGVVSPETAGSQTVRMGERSATKSGRR